MIAASISSSLVPMVLQKIFVARQPTLVTTKKSSWIDNLYDKYLTKYAIKRHIDLDTLNFRKDKNTEEQIQLDLLAIKMQADMQRVSVTDTDKFNITGSKIAILQNYVSFCRGAVSYYFFPHIY